MSRRFSRFFCVLALGALAGCARKGAAPPSTPVAEADPIHDTIGEFRRSERIACAEGTDLVYVVARDGSLHSFDPGELRFRRIGQLDCPGTGRSLPQSMAVDRSGQAWVGYDNGVLALANITNADCVASRINMRSARIGTRFGMGFAPTAEGAIGGETLFLSTEPAFGRLPDGRVARGSSLLVRIDDGVHMRLAGAFPAELRGLTGELSSRSDGKLFAFLTGDPFSLAEIDPATAEVRSQKRLDGMRFSNSGSGSWAFAAVGPAFYFFWADRGGGSVVTRLREDGTLEHVIKDAGMEIVGAGASTCATAHPTTAATPPVAPPDEGRDASQIPPPPPTPPSRPTATTPVSKLPPLPPPRGPVHRRRR